MAKVYKFHASLVALEDQMWPEIKISDHSSVAKLFYAVMASFKCKGYHMFFGQSKNKEFELVYDYESVC